MSVLLRGTLVKGPPGQRRALRATQVSASNSGETENSETRNRPPPCVIEPHYTFTSCNSECTFLSPRFLCATKRARCRKYGSANPAAGSKKRSFGSLSNYKSISCATVGTLRALASAMYFS
jgi:hypothetical protein